MGDGEAAADMGEPLLGLTLRRGGGVEGRLHRAAQCGRASWYAMHTRTASGERMNPSALTAAHRTLPFGTRVKVTNQSNGRTVVVRINDRGPFIRGRVLDLSKGAANQLGFIGSGHTAVCMARV